jgi:phosphoglycolate phosphatase-like HAD superfamily hydrolase
MSVSPARLLLFDIDGTLVQTGRAGQRGMNAAFERLYGHSRALDQVSLAGRTDRAIVAEVFAAIGRHDVAGSDDEVFRLRDAYLEHLGVEIARPGPYPFGVLPGVTPLLDALAGESGAVVALLTGNFEGGAAIKLGHFDLWRRFAFGAFGDRHTDRRDLVPIALERAREAGHSGLGASDVVVIGDTPLDVDCAIAHGARALGVATGSFTAEALRDAGAHHAVDTLEDAAPLVHWMLRGGA